MNVDFLPRLRERHANGDRKNAAGAFLFSPAGKLRKTDGWRFAESDLSL